MGKENRLPFHEYLTFHHKNQTIQQIKDTSLHQN